jgi:hypothetical protein
MLLLSGNLKPGLAVMDMAAAENASAPAGKNNRTK